MKSGGCLNKKTRLYISNLRNNKNMLTKKKFMRVYFSVIKFTYSFLSELTNIKFRLCLNFNLKI
jgi:hypothetical protein